MVNKALQLTFFFLAMAFGALCVNAQGLPEPQGRDPRTGKPEELPKALKENIQKGRIEEEKKEYNEMIKRGEEAARLSEELTKSFEQNQALSPDDVKKLTRLEKLIKKIRDDLGGEDDDQFESNKPSSLTTALKAVQENASSLLSALKKTTRLTISAVAIESSNTLLKLVRFIRFYKN